MRCSITEITDPKFETTAMAIAINIIGTSKQVQNIPIIEISGCPKSNDVIGLQDLYLQLDISNSTVDMVADMWAEHNRIEEERKLQLELDL